MVAALLLAQALHAWVDADYAASTQHGANFLPGTGTSAHRANAFDLNAAAIDVSVDPKPVGLHLTLAYGSAADVLQTNVVQASASFAVGALTLEAGIYPSHIGYESLFSKDNWTYTRGYMGEYSPYYQTGLKATYSFDEHWSAQVHVLNGWQNIADDNRAKAVGTQVAYSGDRLSASLNTFAGPELPGDDSHWRLFADLVTQLKVTPAFSLGFTADAGRQDRPQGAAAWHAAGLYGRVSLNERVALAARLEYYDDLDGFMSGTPQVLKDGTLTLEVRPDPHLILKLEAREDASDAAVFAGKTSQTLGVASAVAVF